MRVLVGNRKCLDPQLLLDLQRLQARALFRQIRIDKIPDTHFKGVRKLDHKLPVNFQRLRCRAEARQRKVQIIQRG